MKWGWVLLFVCIASEVYSQEKDSIKVYEDIREFAYKRKVTKWVYQLVFVEKSPASAVPPPIPEKPGKKKKQTDPLLKVKGKTIRRIEFVSLDPFGASINDTGRVDVSLIKKTANRYHISTRKKILGNQVLLKTGDSLDPLKVKESERLLRTLPYLRDARIQIIPVSSKSDSVDVKVITQDRWTLNGYTTFKPFKTNAGISETNFLGIGHGLRGSISYNLPNLRYSANSSYSIANIGKTYISSSTNFTINPETKTLTVGFDRPVYSSFAKWGGGILYLRNSNLFFNNTDTMTWVKMNNIDPWFGRAIALKSRKEKKFAYRFIAAARVSYSFTDRYAKLPVTFHNSPSTNTLYLTTFAIAAQNYYKDRNIFRFGEAEDIPEGQTFAVVLGAESKPRITVPYTGLKFSHAKHIEKFGYIASELEPGTFVKSGKLYKSVINFYSMYFSDTRKIGNWQLRQFLDYNVVLGFNRDKGELLYLNGTYGIPGYNNYAVYGKSKMSLTAKTMCYVPYRVIGFGFAFFTFASFGTVADQPNGLFAAHVSQGYGMGINIRNEHLVVNTITLSFGVYPNSSGKDFLMNGVSVNENRFRSYLYSKPYVAPYQ